MTKSIYTARAGHWKPVRGFEGLYEVSDRGDVRSLDQKCKCCGHVRHGQILSQAESCGYPVVNLSRDAKKKQFRVSVLVCEAFFGPRPEGYHAAHRDGNKNNNCAWNLDWLTPKENSADKAIHGTEQRGSGHHQAKLDETKVAQIRAGLTKGQTEHSLALEFGVSRGAISNIRRRKTWRHV